MEIVGFWILLSVAIGFWAAKKGRSWFMWMLLSLFVSPLIAGIFLAIASNNTEPAQAQRNMHLTHVRCPDCRELVLKEASKCKHCGTRLVPQSD